MNGGQSKGGLHGNGFQGTSGVGAFYKIVDFVNFFPFSLHPPKRLAAFLFTSYVVNIPRAVRGSNLPSLVHFCRRTCRFQLRYHFPQKADCLRVSVIYGSSLALDSNFGNIARPSVIMWPGLCHPGASKTENRALYENEMHILGVRGG
jgi:hypothetical protein